ncbi:unnamed protein product [Brassica oleracea var. botrytis]|uniref:Uncharacterized protein n=1 Tax=Brassica oleracea TaxID=3712 RepID=A0A3P6F6R7_BRAOL|nr:unnamed protein product [Brassica oleracea]
MTRVSSLFNSFSTSDHAAVVSLNLFVALLCACIVLGHILGEKQWLNESITSLLIVKLTFWLHGLAFGVVILCIINAHIFSSSVKIFSSYIFCLL